MMVNLYPFTYFVLQFSDGEFECVLLSEEIFSNIILAKSFALAGFPFEKNDVPVVMDQKSNMHYYHPRHRVWYKNLSEERLRRLFPWLVPS